MHERGAALATTRSRGIRWILGGLLLGVVSGAGVAGNAGKPASRQARALAPASTGHLDQVFRQRGFEAHAQGRYGGALDYFRMAARFADKPSQLALGMMHLNGEGTPADPAAAYAWLDLAAERGYPDMLALREEVWARLDPAQQARAIELGRGLYAEYGDAVAKPRHWQRVQSHLVGSIGRHASLRGNAWVIDYGNCPFATLRVGAGQLPGSGCNAVFGYFESPDWERDTYWREQDLIWSPSGVVSVGPLLRSRIDGH